MKLSQTELDMSRKALASLENAGLLLYLTDGQLMVGPASKVTAEHRETIKRHRNGIMWWLSWTPFRGSRQTKGMVRYEDGHEDNTV